MKIVLYFKQAWQLLKQNRLFSAIYILGTGLSIAMTMTLVILYYVKMAPVYPEGNRNRTLVTKSMALHMRHVKQQMSSSLSYQSVRDYFYSQRAAEAVTAIPSRYVNESVELPDNRGTQPVQTKAVDAAFWKVFTFSFLSGKPFSESDFKSAIRTAVLSKSMARTLFGEEEAVGRSFQMEGADYRVCGVVQDVSFITPVTYADIWVPYSVYPEVTKMKEWAEGLLGNFEVYMLAPDANAMDALTDNIRQDIRKLNFSQTDYLVALNGQPVPYWKSVFYKYSNVPPDWTELLKTFGTILFALLFVPALNLAGMISSRMNHRLSELGIRKVFGASKGVLWQQILVENLMLTCLGGGVGLLLSYAMVYWGRNWLPMLFSQFESMLPEGVDTLLTWDMLFNPLVFGSTLAICLVLNFLSAVIPAVHALRKNIVYSLNEKR
ncbi:MAG: ABC transporter permease [Bacteroides sp.]